MEKLKLQHNYDSLSYNYIIEEIFEKKIYNFRSTKDSPIIIDCGANIGISIIYFKRLFPKATIYAFEADKTFFNYLKSNINYFKFKNIILFNKAVSDTNGETIFYVSNEKNVHNAPICSLLKNKLADVPINVEAISFGEFIKQFQIVDFCKVDIEGGESLIVKSLIEHKTIFKVKEFIFEYHNWIKQLYDFNEFINKFTAIGFSCTIIQEEFIKGQEKTTSNVIVRFKNNLYD